MEELEYVETLSEKMKRLEDVANTKLKLKTPVIMRLDGRAFSKYTKGLDKPFDLDLSEVFQWVAYKLKENLDNVRFIYSQSDEISILMTDWTNENTDAWFTYRIQKMTSVASGITTALFNKRVADVIEKYKTKVPDLKEAEFKPVEELSRDEKKYFVWKGKAFKAVFDCRVFNVDFDDVVPYFIYRQKDAMRNSVASLAQSYFSFNELQGKKQDEMKQMVTEKTGIVYDELSMLQKAGFAVYKDTYDKWVVDKDIPEFMTNRDYISKFLV